MAAWDHLTQRPVDQVMGAFFFTRRAIFTSLTGFDERFFVYFEEVDFSLRANQAGWKTVYLTDTQAFHQGGGASQRVKAKRLFYSLRSRLLFGFKHFSVLQAWVLMGATLVLELLSRTLFSLFRGGIEDMRDTWNGYAMLYRDLPSILRISDVKRNAKDGVRR